MKSSTPIYEDNEGCIALSQNPLTHSRARHIALAKHVLRERVGEGHVVLHHIPTADQPADLLTKPLDRVPFVKLRRLLMNVIVRAGSAVVPRARRARAA